jgi:hypothetical protein
MERRLLTMFVPADKIPTAPGEGSVLDIGSPMDGYGDEWRLVSHTLQLVVGGALLSVLIERLPIVSSPD